MNKSITFSFLKFTINSFMFIVTSFFLLACQTSADDAFTIDGIDQCQHINLPVGQDLIIRLPSNPSTGYSWTVIHQASVLFPVDEQRIEVLKNNDNRVGVPTQTVWRYKATLTGTDILEIVYQRNWEQKPPAEIFRCEITVK